MAANPVLISTTLGVLSWVRSVLAFADPICSARIDNKTITGGGMTSSRELAQCQGLRPRLARLEENVWRAADGLFIGSDSWCASGIELLHDRPSRRFAIRTFS